MPTVQLNDIRLNYRLDGREDAPVLVLSNSLGTDLHMWDAQVPALAEHFRVLRYDTRGHGGSGASPGPYDFAQLADDAPGLLDALKFSFCGLSMGGLIGQWLGIHAGERLQRLVICNTAAKIGEAEGWNQRIESVLAGGAQAMEAMRDAAMGRWFTDAFRERAAAETSRIADMVASTSPEGYAANCAAVRDADFRGQLGAIARGTRPPPPPLPSRRRAAGRVRGCAPVQRRSRRALYGAGPGLSARLTERSGTAAS